MFGGGNCLKKIIQLATFIPEWKLVLRAENIDAAPATNATVYAKTRFKRLSTFLH